MNKTFENRYGMSYTNQNCKESAWDKICKAVGCYSGWGKTKEEENSFRFGNSDRSIDDSLRSIEEGVNSYKRVVEESIKYRTPRPLRDISLHEQIRELESNPKLDPGQKYRLRTLAELVST